MNYVNNWLVDIVLAEGATECALDLPDGTYRLTLSDHIAIQTRWEIVAAVVVDGVATLTRAQEGTTDQPWAEGSVIYCSVTAGAMTDISTRLVALESFASTAAAQITDLITRVEALEAAALPDGIIITSDAAGNGGIAGYSANNGAGSISPAGASVYPDGEAAPGAVGEILDLAWSDDWPFYGVLQLRVQGDDTDWPDVASLPFDVLTIGSTEYLRTNLADAGSGTGNRIFTWTVASDPFVDGANAVAFT